MRPRLGSMSIACATDLDQLKAWWTQHPGRRAAIEARVAEIKAAATEEPA